MKTVGNITRRTVLASLMLPVVVPIGSVRQRVFNVVDFGADPTGVSDSSRAIQTVVSKCDFNNVIQFSAGSYKINATQGAGIRLNALRATTIDGQNSQLIFDGDQTGISIHRQQGMQMRALSLDWKRATFSQGRIVSRDAQGTRYLVELAPECALGGCEPIYSIHFFRNDGTGRVVVTDRTYARRVWSIVAPNTIEVKYPVPFEHDMFEAVILFHNRRSFGVYFGESSDIELKDITLRTAPGMGIVGTGVETLTAKGCVIAPDPRSTRLISTTADGVHFWGCRGKFTFGQCKIAATGDDGMNIHSFLLRGMASGSEIEMNATNVISGRSVPLHAVLIPKAGDRITLYDLQFGELDEYLVLSAVDRRLMVDRPVATVGPFLLGNSSQMPQVHLNACEFQSGNAAGVLLRGTMLIESCRFQDMAWLGLSGQVDSVWMEGPPIWDVIVRRSVFERCGKGLRGSLGCGVSLQNSLGTTSLISRALHQSLTVEDSSFIDPLGTAIHAANAKSLNIVNNKFRSQRNESDVLSPHNMIIVQNCDLVSITGNDSDVMRRVQFIGRRARLNGRSQNTNLMFS